MSKAKCTFTAISKMICCIILWAAPLAAQAATYYISSSIGNDSNSASQAQNKSTPWAHLPGMPSCTANCASYTPQPGDRFILKGGDTWGNADLGIGWEWAGTAASPIYIGVDQTWFSGSSWARPTFTCGGAVCANGNVYFVGCGSASVDYVTLDDIEMTGLLADPSTSGGGYAQFCGAYDTISNMYMHGWSHGPAPAEYDAMAAISFGGGISNLELYRRYRLR